MSDAERLAPLLLWYAVKRVQFLSTVVLTDADALRLMGIPADLVIALETGKKMEKERLYERAEVKRLQAEVERLRAELGDV